MRNKVLPIENVSRLLAAGDALMHRSPGMPGIGLVWSPTGLGKSTATTWYCISRHGVYVRAMALWTAKVMLQTIARELDIEIKGKHGTNAVLLTAIVDALTESRRPLFVDEADYLLDKRALVDTLRDIHDLSTVPVVLIGEPRIAKDIKLNPRFAGRVSQWVKFEGLHMRDARMVADELCEIEVADDLLQDLYHAASPKNSTGHIIGGAEVRRVVVGLGTIEKFAQQRGRQHMELLDWPKGMDYFQGEAVAHPGARPAATSAGKVTMTKGAASHTHGRQAM